MEQERRPIRMLITDIGHPVTPSTLESLRKIESTTFYIVGIATDPDAVGAAWCDSDYVVPEPGSPEYLAALLDICAREQIEIVVPWTDDEAWVIAEAAAIFEERDIATLCGSFDSIQRANDKGRMLSELKQTDIPTADFELASGPEEMEQAARRLGYPEKRVMVKPRVGSSSLGQCVLDAKVDLLHRQQQLPLSSFLAMLHEAQKSGATMPDYIVMQYLPGEEFSVDILADQGEALYIIPRRRLEAVEGVSVVGEAIANPEVRQIAARIIKHFGLHLNVNMQFKYSEVAGGQPMVYDINPRISGTIVANAAAGVNMLYYGIRFALGKSIPAPSEIQVRQTKIVRYWAESCLPQDKWFSP